MADTATLLSTTLVGERDDFPARIGTTAQELEHAGRARFAVHPNMLELCGKLHADEVGRFCFLEQADLTAKDIQVFAFFLRRSTALQDLMCVVVATEVVVERQPRASG